MQIEKLPDIWLFELHSKQTIRAWVRQLRYFYYKRAWGGHANDGEETTEPNNAVSKTGRSWWQNLFGSE